MKFANPTYSVSDCLSVLEANRGLGVPIVDSERRLVAVLTDGDIRRFLIAGRELSENCLQAANQNFFFVQSVSEITPAHKAMYSFVPVLDSSMKIREFVTSSLVTAVDANRVAGVIMAGGFGTRLRPLTNNLPKPLVDLDGTSLIERILERFAASGLRKVYVSVNYLAEQITDALGDGSKWGIEIEYVTEDKPLGTGGALGRIEDCKHETLILTNGDIYSELDFAKFINFHENHAQDLTMATVQYSVTIPFGVVTHSGGQFEDITEKPTYSYQCNSGIYAISRNLLSLIPKNEHFNLPDLIDCAHAAGHKIGVYEMSEYWADIGNITELEKNRQMLEVLKRSEAENAK